MHQQTNNAFQTLFRACLNVRWLGFNYFGYNDGFTSNNLSFQSVACSHIDTGAFPVSLVKILFPHLREIKFLQQTANCLHASS